ncbi:AraC family transcriptional regulator [Stagnihabitans tardus]|uniref:Helix-turn-helix domain-containing protein n=1 Tax=Stagnihabitans tardus TaxID=2699202 RepID=A0AAE4YDB5_9RHOB|nr:AraC family transcriptional regulator [Stagnihabitans tardus]NBZ88199.1 helix-turn-helix domain-containing protein [Stagnihabitans tardus]
MAQDYERRLTRVIDHIHDNPDGDLSLDALADVAALSRFHFHRVFQAMTGMTAAALVRQMRLHRAAVALVLGDQPVDQIARACGFPSRAALARAFADHFGATPLAFRKSGAHRPFTLSLPLKGPLMHPVTLRTDPARRLAAMPHKGAYYQISRAFEKLGATLGARGLYGQAGLMVGVYYDSPGAVAEADLRSHAGVELPQGEIAAPLEEITLPAGRHAVLTFRGPYAGLQAAYDQLFGIWLPASGETPADSPVFEVYLNTPMDTAPEDLLTEICLPLA